MTAREFRVTIEVISTGAYEAEFAVVAAPDVPRETITELALITLADHLKASRYAVSQRYALRNMTPGQPTESALTEGQIRTVWTAPAWAVN